MKLISIGYDKGFNLLFQFGVFIESCTQKPLTVYYLETVPVPIEDNHTEASCYNWLQLRKGYLAVTEEIYIALATAELSACKHIGHESFCESLLMVKHKTS